MNFDKENSYYRYKRFDILSLIPKYQSIERVLDVGCGSGNTGKFLKETFNVKEVVGIELNESLSQESKNNLDKLIVGDVQTIHLPFEVEYFDCIILADVLEHLYNPWDVMERLKSFLKYDGIILASLPNVQHWTILLELLRGEWDYKKTGILDNTHIRFFTRKSIEKMFLSCGYDLLEIRNSMGSEMKILNKITFGFFSGFLTYRYFVLAKKH